MNVNLLHNKLFAEVLPATVVVLMLSLLQLFLLQNVADLNTVDIGMFN